jgi:hypothetical protein
MVRSKLMPALSPVIFGLAELNPVTEPEILPVPRLTVVWAWSMLVSRRSEKAKTLVMNG